MPKPLSLTEHAALLRRYREHYTIIFGTRGSDGRRLDGSVPSVRPAVGAPGTVTAGRAAPGSGTLGAAFPPPSTVQTGPPVVPAAPPRQRVTARLRRAPEIAASAAWERAEPTGPDSWESSVPIPGFGSPTAPELAAQTGTPYETEPRWQSPPLPPLDERVVAWPEAGSPMAELEGMQTERQNELSRAATDTRPVASVQAEPAPAEPLRQAATGQLGFRELLSYAASGSAPALPASPAALAATVSEPASAEPPLRTGLPAIARLPEPPRNEESKDAIPPGVRPSKPQSVEDRPEPSTPAVAATTEPSAQPAAAEPPVFRPEAAPVLGLLSSSETEGESAPIRPTTTAPGFAAASAPAPIPPREPSRPAAALPVSTPEVSQQDFDQIEHLSAAPPLQATTALPAPSAAPAQSPAEPVFDPSPPLLDIPADFRAPGDDPDAVRRLLQHLPAAAPGVGISLPRRPRPVPQQPPKVAEVVQEAPMHSPAQAQSYLDRLNRMIESEENGTSEARALSLAELLTWQNRPREVEAPEKAEEPPDTAFEEHPSALVGQGQTKLPAGAAMEGPETVNAEEAAVPSVLPGIPERLLPAPTGSPVPGPIGAGPGEVPRSSRFRPAALARPAVQTHPLSPGSAAPPPESRPPMLQPQPEPLNRQPDSAVVGDESTFTTDRPSGEYRPGDSLPTRTRPEGQPGEQELIGRLLPETAGELTDPLWAIADLSPTPVPSLPGAEPQTRPEPSANEPRDDRTGSARSQEAAQAQALSDNADAPSGGATEARQRVPTTGPVQPPADEGAVAGTPTDLETPQEKAASAAGSGLPGADQASPVLTAEALPSRDLRAGEPSPTAAALLAAETRPTPTPAALPLAKVTAPNGSPVPAEQGRGANPVHEPEAVEIGEQGAAPDSEVIPYSEAAPPSPQAATSREPAQRPSMQVPSIPTEPASAPEPGEQARQSVVAALPETGGQRESSGSAPIPTVPEGASVPVEQSPLSADGRTGLPVAGSPSIPTEPERMTAPSPSVEGQRPKAGGDVGVVAADTDRHGIPGSMIELEKGAGALLASPVSGEHQYRSSTGQLQLPASTEVPRQVAPVPRPAPPAAESASPEVAALRPAPPQPVSTLPPLTAPAESPSPPALDSAATLLRAAEAESPPTGPGTAPTGSARPVAVASQRPADLPATRVVEETSGPAPSASPSIQPALTAQSTPGTRPGPETPPLSRQDQALQKALEHPGDPLPLSVRARLAPVMGRELGAVRLLRTAEAAAATAAAAADALALGDRVLLSPGQDLTSPRGLGLLAHELTHVLRERDPGFVPLVARESVAREPVGLTAAAPVAGIGALHAVQAQPRGARDGTGSSTRAAVMSEEGLAEYVEARVRREVQVQEAAVSAASESPWGGLPAPWEPLPFWDAPAPTAGTAPSGPARRAPDGPPGGASSGPGQASARPPSPAQAPVAQAASTSRSVDSGPAPAPASSLGAAVGSDHRKSASPPPDLDRLAQQVYGMIKQRLATETRRNH